MARVRVLAAVAVLLASLGSALADGVGHARSSSKAAEVLASEQALASADCAPNRDLLDTFTHVKLGPSLGSCALVGSGGALKGKGLGGVINSHDTVIRVNRVPSDIYFRDLGNKTDVFFSNSATDTYPGGQIGAWITRMQENDPVGLKLWCQFEHKISVPRNCPFSSIIVARSTKYGTDRVGESINIPFRIEEYMQPPFPVAHPSLALETFYWNAAPLEGYYASGGLKAFLTTAPMCDSIVLYGFSGSGNIDNHTIDSVHSFDVEHSWMHRIAAGDLRDEDFRAVDAEDWLLQNGLNLSVLHTLPHFIEGLKRRLQCMADDNKITIDGWSQAENLKFHQDYWQVIDSESRRPLPSLRQLRDERGIAGLLALVAFIWGTIGLAAVAWVLGWVVRRHRQPCEAGREVAERGQSDSDAGSSSSLLLST